MKRKIFITGLTLTMLLGSYPVPVYGIEESVDQESRLEETLESSSSVVDSTLESIIQETTQEDDQSFEIGTTNESIEETVDIEETIESSYSETIESEDQINLQYFDSNYIYPSNRSDLNEAEHQAVSPSVSALDDSLPFSNYVDISAKHGNLTVDDFKIMKSYGITGIVVKLTESTSYKNPFASEQIKNAAEAELTIAVSHYSTFNDEQSAKSEAEYFANLLLSLNLSKDTVLINDIEELNEDVNQTNNSKIFEAKLNELGFNKVNHYISGEWLYKELIDPNVLGVNKIWMAAYPYKVSQQQQFSEYAAWQWTNQFSFPDINGLFSVSSNYSDNKDNTKQESDPSDVVDDNDEQKLEISTFSSNLVQKIGKYVTIKSSLPLWQVEKNTMVRKGNTANFIGQTFKIKSEFVDSKKTSYYLLINGKNQEIGYVSSLDIDTTDSPGGAYHSYGKYVTMISPNYTMWQNFNWQKRNHSSDYNGMTLEARGYYNHFNGDRYLSLYDNKGAWLGYINENATRLGNNAGGAYHSYGKYVTMVSPNYTMWQSFNWQKRNHSSDYNGMTLEAKGYYNHFNGDRYLSLYDNKGAWLGYINENATRLGNGSVGAFQGYGDYVTMVSPNYTMWQNFNWQKRNHSSDYVGSHLQALGYYDHFNGERYLSLYTPSGMWLGYINENATNIKDLYKSEAEFDKNYNGKSVHLFVMGHGAGDPGAVGSGTNERDFTRNELPE
ncbi:GH25 family lysozyme [Enterococcus olivae]